MYSRDVLGRVQEYSALYLPFEFCSSITDSTAFVFYTEQKVKSFTFKSNTSVGLSLGRYLCCANMMKSVQMFFLNCLDLCPGLLVRLCEVLAK